MPYLSNRAPWFVFLVHPRGMDDLYRDGTVRFVRRYSDSEAEVRAKACSLPPVVVGDAVFGSSTVRGELISVMRMPETMTDAGAARAVLEGAKVALQRGARVIGLGALTAPATGGGVTLLRHLPAGVTLTNGNAYTAAIVRHNVAEAHAALGLDRRALVAVVGCTGSVGVPTSQLLAAAGFDLLLIGRSVERARHLLGELAGCATFSGDMDDVRGADIVVLLTNDGAARITPERVRAGTVVIDCAQPANVEPATHHQFRRRGITIVEGGIVRIPGFASTYDLGLADPAEAFACLAETYLLARAGIRDHSVGCPSVEAVQRMERLAQRYGVRPRPLDLEADWQGRRAG